MLRHFGRFGVTCEPVLMCLMTLTACLFTGRAPLLARMAKEVLIVPEAAIRSILLMRAARAGLITEADFFFI